MEGNVEFRTSVYQNPKGQVGSTSSSNQSHQSGSLVQPSSITSESGVQKSFADTLNDAIHEVNQLQKKSDRAMQDLSTGKTDNIPEVMLAAEKADIALKLMIQVRNKIIDAYHEVMKMQV